MPSAYLCSFPKSGRTWMRFALAQLMRDIYGIDDEMDLVTMFHLIPNNDVDGAQPGKGLDNYAFASNPEIPLIVMSHRPWESEFSEAPVVFLVRNPADAIVSRYWHLHLHQGRFNGSMDDYVRSPQGARELVNYLASWAEHSQDGNVVTLTYEQLRADTLRHFSILVSQLGLGASREQMKRALELSSVDKMRQLEKDKGVGEPHNYDRDNPNALRVRKAEVGGFKKEMGSETLNYLLGEIARSEEASTLLTHLGLMPEATA